jgi:hypothetical protein
MSIVCVAVSTMLSVGDFATQPHNKRIIASFFIFILLAGIQRTPPARRKETEQQQPAALPYI